MRHLVTTIALLLAGFCLVLPAAAQPAHALIEHADNVPLPSLERAAQEALARAPVARSSPYAVPNKPLPGPSTRTREGGYDGPDAVGQTRQGTAATSLLTSFEGASNDDNAAVVGFMVAPPDTDADVGPSHVVQMINLVTTIYDKSGAILSGPFPTNAFWSGQGGLCEPFNQGDPIVLYDEAADRWLVSQFAFDDDFTTFAQCVAISQTGDPTGGYNRYEFSFDAVGFNDYPKHGIVSNSITMMANIFQAFGPFFNFAGTYVGVMDKNAMYAGQPATLVGFNLGTSEFGFVAADLDDPTGTAATVPALFATAMSTNNRLDLWEIDIDWANPGGASVGQIASLPIAAYDADLCSASREECVPQPGTSQRLEAISDRLMHRLQVRDFGTHRSMVTAHTVDVGSGRAGVRWYEMRESAGAWSLYQQGTYGPNDGLNRWMASVAMNAAGDIGLGYLVSNGSDTFLSTGVAGQTAAASGSGALDAAELVCAAGTGPQTGTGRAGDYSATSVDPVSDSFWHTNEYVGGAGGSFAWDTRVCEFSVGGGTATPPAAPSNLIATAVSSSQIDLTWADNSGDETSFEVERAPDGTSFALVATLGANATAYSDGSLAASTTYTYRTRACNGAGCSAYSNLASATTQSGGGPTKMYVSSIITETVNAGKGNKRGRATVTIRDDLGDAVSGATVSGRFGGSFNESASGTTGAGGTVVLTTTATARRGVQATYCVSGVTHGTLTYDPSLNADPSYACSGTAPSGIALAADARAQAETTDAFVLEGNYPNPFNPATRVAFMLPEGMNVTLRVYDVLGREVATLVDGYREAGRHEVFFDGSSLGGGIYLYALQAGEHAASGRMTLLK